MQSHILLWVYAKKILIKLILCIFLVKDEKCFDNRYGICKKGSHIIKEK